MANPGVSEPFLREDTEIVPGHCVPTVEDPLQRWWGHCTGRDGLGWESQGVLQLVSARSDRRRRCCSPVRCAADGWNVFIRSCFRARLRVELPSRSSAPFWGKVVFLPSPRLLRPVGSGF